MKKLFIGIGVCAVAAGIVSVVAFRTGLTPGEIRTTIEASLLGVARELNLPSPLRGTLSSDTDSHLTVEGVVSETNAARVAEGLPKLSINEKLSGAAQLKVDDMFARQYFEHTAPDGKGPGDLADAVEYGYIVIGENLALGNFENDAVLVQAWMDSPGHRANILNSKYTEIGVAVGRGMYEGVEVWFAVQEFGTPESSCATIDSSLKETVDRQSEALDVLEKELELLSEEIESMNPKTRTETNAYNEKVREYNAMLARYQNDTEALKKIIDTYNTQVRAYNACVRS